MPEKEIRKQMEAVAREFWGEERARALAGQIELTASALGRVDAVTLDRSDDLDYLEGK